MTASYQLAAFRQMARNDLQGAKITVNSKTVSGTCGCFEFQPDLVNGGFSPHLSATVEVAALDLPKNTVFQKGQSIQVTPNTGTMRNCRIESFTQSGALWQIMAMDTNQNA